MQNTSLAYKEQFNRPLRNESYMKVTFGIVEPQALPASTISSDDEVYYSEVESVGDVSKSNLPFLYSTLEHNHYLLDGNASMLPNISGTPIYQGFVSTQMSDENRVFSVPPSITIDFSDYFQFTGLTFKFDSINGDYPTLIRVKAYEGLTEVFNSTGEIQYFEDVFEQQIPMHNKLIIEFLETSKPYRRIRLTHILFGIVKVFTDDVLVSTNDKRSVDPLNMKLPKYEFSFTFLDIEKTYNPDNPNGVYQYLESQQPIKFEYGYRLDDDTIEWITGGNNFTTGEVTIDSQGGIPRVTFKSSSTLEYLTDIYDEGIYSTTPKTFKQLAQEVLEYSDLPLDEFGEPMWILDDFLETYSTTVPLPRLPIRECLQLIANASTCVLWVNRDGKIVISPMETEHKDFLLDFKTFKSPPTIKKYPPLYAVRTSFTAINVNASSEELSKVDVSSVFTRTFYFDYDPATNVSLSISAGLTMVGSPEYFTYGCRVSLYGTGTVTIVGKKLNYRFNPVTVNYGNYGEECPVNNDLINNSQHALEYAVWVGDIIRLSNEYTAENRGYPEIDPVDIFDIQTLFQDVLPVILLENNISYNGGISGTSKFLTGGDI